MGKHLEQTRITAEMLKADTEQTSQEMKRILDLIWTEENVPERWTKGLICKIPKKGNLQDCNNWRGVHIVATSQQSAQQDSHKQDSDRS